MVCRICGCDKLEKFLDLGFTPPADDFLVPERLNNSETYYPLRACICPCCSLVQLDYVVDPEILFQGEYPYESSTTKTGVAHYHLFAKQVCSRFNLSNHDLVVDLGSNIGVLLQGFKNEGIKVLGVDPAKNIAKKANELGIETIPDFFTENVVKNIIAQKGQAKVITGTNVIAHINDLHALLRAIDALLIDDGVFIFEAPYLVDLIENFEFDTIYHEHLSYLSLKPLKFLFDKYGFEIFDVEKKSIHGGTLRYFIARKGKYNISKNVDDFCSLEKEKKIYNLETLKKFADQVSQNRDDLVWLLKSIKRDGKSIAGVSAPAKGMTLLNYCKIGNETLDFITEKNSMKIGKYTPGTHIFILSDNELIKRKPDYVLLLAWNFADEIIDNLKEYKKNGGKFIIPVPKPFIVE
ncbi:MAG: C-methyltransferase [candidate division TM6 bacterium GW2011_GWF2_28_16]|nr:MAG: C-methyltransferase [candidate division TM6 bacterium GW2011_GWF2_28_16]